MKKIISILVCVSVFVAISQIPYLNILFPLWVATILSVLFSLYILKYSKKVYGVILMLLWVTTMGALLVKSTLVAENIAIAVFFLFSLSIGRDVFFLLKNKSI